MHGQVIEGRECGSCTVCCVALTIDDPALQKVQGYRCPNLTPLERLRHLRDAAGDVPECSSAAGGC